MLNLFLVKDMVRFTVHSYDEEPFAQWFAPQIDIVLGPEGTLPEEEIPVPGDTSHYNAITLMMQLGSEETIARHYLEKYRPESLPLLSQVPEPEPITWANKWEVSEASRKMLGINFERDWGEKLLAAAAESLPPVVPAPPPLPAATPDLVPAPYSPTGATSQPKAEAIGGMTLSEAKKEFLDFHALRKGDRRTDEDAGLVIDFLIDFMGDIPINSLTPENFLEFETALAATPNRQGIPPEHSGSLMARYRYAKKQGWDNLQPMSVTRIKNVWHVSLKQFFVWLQQKNFYSGPKPHFSLVPHNARKARTRAQWTDEELLRLFRLPLFTGCESQKRFWSPGKKFVQNELYWAYCLIFLTGMRNSEIGSLRTTNIKQDKNKNWIFDLHLDPSNQNETRKTEHSERKIPVHQLLIDLGLLERKADLEKAGTERLFPEWKDHTKPSGQAKPGHHFSKSWQYIKTHFNFERQGLTVYGGRHTRAGWYDVYGLTSRLRKIVLGHALESVDDRYGGPELTAAEMETVRNAKVPLEEAIADILLTAKLRALDDELDVVKTWLPENMRPRLKRKPLPARAPLPSGGS